MGLPARGYKWKDAEPGNFLALKHGATSPRVVAELAKVLRDEVVERLPWLTAPEYETALELWARSTARSKLLDDYIFSLADTPEKVPVRVWTAASSSARAALAAGAELGLSPASKAQISATVAAGARSAEGLKLLQEKGAEIRQRRSDQGE